MYITIFEFIESINDNDIVFTIFNHNTEELISMRLDDGSFTTEFNLDDLLYGNYGDISIDGTNIWVDSDGRIHIKFDVDVDEEEYEWEEE